MGAGYHGGFGNTKGSGNSQKKGYQKADQGIRDKNQLFNGVDGVTEHASDIIKKVKAGKIKVSVLGDRLFEEYLGEVKNTAAVAIGEKIYLRRSSVTALSDFVHEGTHALDHLAGKLSKMTVINSEMRAYKREHEFQKAAGIPLEFANEDDIRVHVFLNYGKKGGRR